MRRIVISILVLSLILAAAVVFARISSDKNAFRQAEDFPREALIYVQIRDLPALIRFWSESDLRRKYFESANFKEFRNGHLALKLIERADEIYEQVGVVPNLGFASTLSETGAALAVYDVGKMEFVFVAPVKEESFLASALVLIKSNFEEIRLDDETIVYSKEIEVDRARQRQKVLFTHFRGRLVLATSEKYFLQTLDNIKEKSPGNRLSTEPLFRRLAEKTKPHLATVWLNQQKLNDDWYFKHYWLMSDVESLKNLRAGMFDFEIDGKNLVERRVFSTVENSSASRIRPETANRIFKLIPDQVLFYKIEAVENQDYEKTVTDFLFDVKVETEKDETVQTTEDYNYYGWEKSYSYSHLDSDFSEQINETEDEFFTEGIKPRGDLSRIISAANPSVSSKLFSPKSLPPPFFFDNRKALILSLQNPANLNRKALESELSKTAQQLFTVENPAADFVWTDFASEDFSARAMKMPALGWSIFYAVRGSELIFSGSEEFIKEILMTREKKTKFTDGFEKFTVIDFSRREEVFDKVFMTLATDNSNPQNIQDDFFTGNVLSLLEAAAEVERVEIRQNSDADLLFEEIDFVLKKKN